MGGLWRRRPVRHLVIGLVPLLVVNLTLIAVLAVRFESVSRPLRQATARATASVVQAGLGPKHHDIDLRWTDAHGQQHVSRVTTPDVTSAAAGTQVTVSYVPTDTGRVYLAGDVTSVRLRSLAVDLAGLALLTVLALAVSAGHVLLRLRAERRPAITMPVSYARSKRGLVHRSWLVVNEQGRDWWFPVHWDPALPRLLSRTPAAVHGRPSANRFVCVMTPDNTPLWTAGRRRPAPPRSGALIATPTWSKAAQKTLRVYHEVAGARQMAPAAKRTPLPVVPR